MAYAVKANPDPALLRRLATDGFGFEVVGPVELALALRAGADPRRIVVNGVGQTDADLAAALASGALVNAESLGALDALLRSADGRIGIRGSTRASPPTPTRTWPPARRSRSSASPSTSWPPRDARWMGRRGAWSRSGRTSAPTSTT